MDGLRDSAVQLAAHHLDIASSVKELCESSHDAVDAGLLMAQDDAAMVTEGVWRAVLACWDADGHLLSTEQRDCLMAVLQSVSALRDSLLFLPHLFHQHVIKQLPQVPLEVMCKLHSVDLLSLETFLESGPSAVQYLVSALASVSCIEGEGQQTVMQIVGQALCELVVNRSAVALEVVQQLLAVLLTQRVPVSYSVMRAAVECPAISASAAVELGSVLLSACLTHPPSSMLEVVPVQSSWQYIQLPDTVTLLYSDLLAALDSAHFIQLVQKALSVENQLNWPALLQAVVCFLHTSPEAPDALLELVKEIVIGGLEDCDAHLLGCGLLIARQASLEGAHVFPSYQSWLQTMFGDNSSGIISGRKQLLFLLRVLTSFVPHDPVFALKAHVSHPPRQVAKCLNQLNDYITLVSTRLHDLGEKQVPSSGEGAVDDASGDVADAIAYYSQHGRISQPVMEASIFRLPYFVGWFLRSLLSPSPIATDGSREKLINALAREKKIPPSMLKNYRKACLELRERETALGPVSGSVACVLRDLPCIVKEAKSLSKFLSRLSACLQEDTRLCPPPTLRTVQLVDDILSAVCETVILLNGQPDASCRWVDDLMAMLSTHTALHQPLHLRIAELLTTQLPDLTESQMLGLAILLCHTFCQSPTMASVMDGRKLLKSGEDYCTSLLSCLSHDTPTCRAQCLRFGCLFIEHLMSCPSSESLAVPVCLLRKMVYLFRRETFHSLPQHTTPSLLKVVQSVETLVCEHHIFAVQWHDCKLDFEQWLFWEMDVDPTNDGMMSYCWDVVFRSYMPKCSAEDLFITIFNTVADRYRNSLSCSGFIAILQELSRILLARNSTHSTLLQALQGILSTTSSVHLATNSMMIALTLPPHFLFTSCQGYNVPLVANFIQLSLAPLMQDMLVLPPHITHYLMLGACRVADDALRQLCDLSPVFLASSMTHWPLLSAAEAPYSDEVKATASWIHSGGTQGAIPPSCSPSHLAIALWHYLTGSKCSSHEQLKHIPAEAVVLVSACCVHWLAKNSHPGHHMQPTLNELLLECLQCEPSAIEVFCSTAQTTEVTVKHSKLLSYFRRTFSCKPSAFYPLLLLRLVGKLSVPMMHSLMSVSCFLWLCVSAHACCHSLCIPLPLIPPLTYQPLSVDFIQDSNVALHSLIHQADCSQLKRVLGQCNSQLQILVISKLNSHSINIEPET